MDLITMESKLWENEHCIDIFISLMRFRRPVPVTELAEKCGTLEQNITNFCHMSESPFCLIGDDIVSFSPFAQKFFNQYLERFYSSSFLEIYPVSVPFPQSPNHLSQDFPNSSNLMLSFCKDGTISLMSSFGHPSPSLNTPSPISIIKNEPSSSTLFQLFLKEGECLLHSPHSPLGSYHLGSRKRTISGNESSSTLGAANKIRKLLLDGTQEAITVENHQKEDAQGLATEPCTTGQVETREDHVHLDELQDVNSEKREDEPCTTGQVKTREDHVHLDELQDVNFEKREDADTKNCKQAKTRCLKKIICRALKSRKRKEKNRNQKPAQVPKLAVLPEKKNEPEDVPGAGQNQDDMVQVEQPDLGMSHKLVKKQFPVFEDYLVESEEGSGGYGTVYRARRKADGMTFAIKCPLAKTTRDLIDNEVKALKSLGGKHNVAKLEGVVEGNGQKAIVLEYIEHEKLELLKKDISLKELQAYGYCLFRALSHLHSKKIMHRDVKPGNFLFSRKKGAGYLVDFNLALEQDKECPHPRKPKVNSSNRSSICDKKESQDLLQKRDLKQVPIRTGNRIKMDSQMDSHNASARSSCTLLNHSKLMKQIALEETGKMATPTGMPKRCSKGFTLNSSPSLKSGILVSSPRMQGSPMGGSPKEPLPKTGRRQLLDYVAKAVTSPQPQIACLPASQSKRVAAPQKKVAPYSKKVDRPKSSKKDSEFAQERRHEMFKRKGHKKQQKHGPCVGTKGYRAPEVLLRSLNQSVMVDIWSAGVTLLQLAAARSPFSSGCVEQAFKDIAKMRGSLGLIKLAKEHQRIQSLPQEIYGMDQPNITVEDWFIKNTRRPDLRSKLPPSFFDLIERCMQIDPAKRLTAATATRHEFFAKASTT